MTLVTSGTAGASGIFHRIQTQLGAGVFNTGRCLDIRTEDPPGNAQLQLWNCGDGDELQFYVVKAGLPVGGPDDLVEIVDKRLANCATVPPGNELTLRQDIRMMPCTAQPNSLWRIVDTGGGYGEFVQYGSGQCLDIRNGQNSNGAHIQQFTCNGTVAQHWRITDG